MSLQSRLSTLISAIGADIKTLLARTSSSNYSRIVRNANAAGGNDYTRSSVTLAAIDSTNLQIVRTCTGRPVTIKLRGTIALNTAGAQMQLQARMDGNLIDGGGLFMISASAGQQIPINLEWDLTPSAGSHAFEFYWATGNAAHQATLYARSTIPVQLIVEEKPYG